MSRYFTQLNYSLGDEDNKVEMNLMEPDCPQVLSIAGSGGRVLPLLAKNPQRIYCVDILDEQLFLSQLRIQSIKLLDFDDFAGFWGYPPFQMTPGRRKEIFRMIKMTSSARAYLSQAMLQHAWGEPIYMGKFEKTLQTLSKVVRFLMGNRSRAFFDLEDLDAQKEYLNKKFPHASWNMVLYLLANSTVLNALLYKGDFPRKNIKISTFSHFKKVFNNIFNHFHIRESYFAQMVFLGKLFYPEGNLPEADPDCFFKIKDSAQNCEISYHQGDVITIIQKSGEKFNFISLSDVPSFFDNDKILEKQFLNFIADNVAPEGIVVTRGSLRICDPDQSRLFRVNRNYSNLLISDCTQLWRIDVYQSNE